mmetsp:Transcript_23970/g.50132  ORF Transcript_23970/g.50132 Transcript_23970/m.50132 type:complete len:263 (+) Transcript_23970:693-1481(+)
MGAEFSSSKEEEGVEDRAAAVPGSGAKSLPQLALPACRLDVDHDELRLHDCRGAAQQAAPGPEPSPDPPGRDLRLLRHLLPLLLLGRARAEPRRALVLAVHTRPVQHRRPPRDPAVHDRPRPVGPPHERDPADPVLPGGAAAEPVQGPAGNHLGPPRVHHPRRKRLHHPPPHHLRLLHHRGDVLRHVVARRLCRVRQGLHRALPSRVLQHLDRLPPHPQPRGQRQLRKRPFPDILHPARRLDAAAHQHGGPAQQLLPHLRKG